MRADHKIRVAAILLGYVLMHGCARHPVKQTPALPVGPSPAPPSTGDANIPLPPGDGAGGFKTINRSISGMEVVWHVRSALNVAALACNDQAIVANYNAMLKQQKAALSTAYEAEAKGFQSARGGSWQAAMDAHMTRLYNYFAQYPVQRPFCAAASRVAADVQSVKPGELQGFSSTAITRLDQVFQDYYRAAADYRRDLALGKVSGAAAPPSQDKSSLGAPWRVQLGAFSGWDAARSAWQSIRSRAPGLATFEPHFEEASRKGLVRLQIGPATNRAEALRLCAAAATAGLDCLPVSPGR